MNAMDIRSTVAARLRRGNANKISLAFDVLALISWLISVAFFGILGVDQELRNIVLFPVWLFELIGVFTLATSITYTLFSYRLIGAIVSSLALLQLKVIQSHVLSWLFALSGGCTVYIDLIVETGAWEREDLERGNEKYIFHFVVTFFALIFHGLAIMLWPYFKDDTTGHWSRQPSHRHFKDPEEPFSTEIALTSMNTQTNAYSPRAVVPPALTNKEHRVPSSASSIQEDYEPLTNDPVNPPPPSPPPPPPDSVSDDSQDAPTAFYEDINKRVHGGRIRVTATRNSEPRDGGDSSEDYVVNQLVYEEPQQAEGEYDVAEEQYVVNQLVYEEPLQLDTHDEGGELYEEFS